MAHTHTYTRYFGEDQVVGLRAEVAALEEDAEGRMPHVTAEARNAIQSRLAVLRAAVDLLVEPVPASFGG